MGHSLSVSKDTIHLIPKSPTNPRYAAKFHNKYISSKELMNNISLLSKPDLILKYLPRQFTIKTNKNSCKFNIDLLTNKSILISNYLRENPHASCYDLNFNDDKNVLLKLEQSFQGEQIEITADEKDIFLNLLDQLQMTKLYGHTIGNYNTNLIKILIDSKNQTFTIQTKKSEYICNIFSIYSSSTIREILRKEPHTTHYFYDYEDEDGQFQYICDIFNFKLIELTNNNAQLIYEMTEDLGIESITKEVSDFLDNIEKRSQKIDGIQNSIDKIEELFDLLFHIKEKTVSFVSEKILNSKWLKEEVKIFDLASCIIQVARTNIQLQQYLIDLLLKLNDDSNKMLLQYVVHRLKFLFKKEIDDNKKNDLIFPFVYKMVKKGVIQQNDINQIICDCKLTNPFFISWFLPELIDNYTKFKIKLNKNALMVKNGSISLFYPCDSSKMDEYKKMRDNDEDDNKIAKILREDDIDTFQSIVSKDIESSINKTIKQNMFEPFIDEEIRYLNYAAAYGSIKCFKYLLLNNEKCDESSFEMAVMGGNIELIRIVDNEKINDDNNIKKKKEN